jgi:hypothetical protein
MESRPNAVHLLQGHIMRRRARITLPNVPIHIIQRGNNRHACFFADEDYQFYLQWLRDHATNGAIEGSIGADASIDFQLANRILKLFRQRMLSSVVAFCWRGGYRA